MYHNDPLREEGNNSPHSIRPLANLTSESDFASGFTMIYGRWDTPLEFTGTVRGRLNSVTTRKNQMMLLIRALRSRYYCVGRTAFDPVAGVLVSRLVPKRSQTLIPSSLIETKGELLKALFGNYFVRNEHGLPNIKGEDPKEFRGGATLYNVGRCDSD